MRAMVIDRYGSPDVLRIEEVEKPKPGNGEILVRVAASSVNALDWHFMRGAPFLVRLRYGLVKPKVRILGYDVAGTVETVGAGVTSCKPGDRVFGGTGFSLGGFAEYVLLKADDFNAPIPSGVSFEQAAAVPAAAAAALMGLRERGGLRSGQRVLINGTSGGVGTFAVQIARALGAEVTAVCSGGKTEMALRLGAERAIDYTREDFTAGSERYDLLLDNVGNRRVEDLLKVIRPGGTCVIVGFTNMRLMLHQSFAGPRAAKSRGVAWSSPDSEDPNKEHAEFLAGLLADGAVVPEIERIFSLDELPEAMRLIETGHARAKIVVRIEPRR